MTTPAERVALTVYLRGSFFPPLPLEYVDWVASLLPSMEQAVWDAEYNDLRAIDAMIPVPAAVIATRILPKAMRDDDGAPSVRLGDLISALRLYDRFTTPADDSDGTEE